MVQYLHGYLSQQPAKKYSVESQDAFGDCFKVRTTRARSGGLIRHFCLHGLTRWAPTIVITEVITALDG